MKIVFLPPQTQHTREWAARLAETLPEVSVVVADDAKAAEAAIRDADAAFGTLPPEMLPLAQRLRWIQAPHAAPPAGYYHLALIAHPLVVTNFREIYNDHIGAHIMMYVLNFARGMQRYFPQQLRREWSRPPRDGGVVALAEATLLIVGVGGIGAEAARLASTFGMRVIGTDARRDTPPPGVAELHPPQALDALLPQADFVVLTVPHTPATEGFFDRTRFRRMKPSAFFINIGRGKTVRLDDLAAALQSGEIAGAGLDVFETEPLPADHALWTMPGAIITPHTAGFGPHLNARRYDIILDNCRRFIAGKLLRNIVDKPNWF
jgi:phosphoglycerate dehydrogenase-like enzyme